MNFERYFAKESYVWNRKTFLIFRNSKQTFQQLGMRGMTGFSTSAPSICCRNATAKSRDLNSYQDLSQRTYSQTILMIHKIL